MIGWLKGEKLESWYQGNRQGVLIDCGGVGYEVQTSSKTLLALDLKTTLTLWIHHLHRDEGQSLFGFPRKNERDLFRILLSVSGIGPQMALGLLEALETEELVNALINSDITKLTLAQGVGKRTAERLSMELHTKLIPFQSEATPRSTQNAERITPDLLNLERYQDLHSTLITLGYEDLEIRRAIKSITQASSKELDQNAVEQINPDNQESLLRASLLWLSNKAA